jgi:hypothetical protein
MKFHSCTYTPNVPRTNAALTERAWGASLPSASSMTSPDSDTLFGEADSRDFDEVQGSNIHQDLLTEVLKNILSHNHITPGPKYMLQLVHREVERASRYQESSTSISPNSLHDQ